ncbi:MAG: recombination protein O N-terminal domain-containing protein [Patescibacteria group bacterium]
MQEYLSEAVVLDRLPNGNLDGRVVFLTKRFGKLTGKAKSVRKITSKLSGHLQPGNLIQLRLVEKNGLQVVDALKKSKLSFSPSELRFLGEVLAEAEPEFRIWEMLVAGAFSWSETLRILGWDPNFASCAGCHGTIDAFHPRTQEFFCKNCASKLPADEVLYININ